MALKVDLLCDHRHLSMLVDHYLHIPAKKSMFIHPDPFSKTSCFRTLISLSSFGDYLQLRCLSLHYCKCHSSKLR